MITPADQVFLRRALRLAMNGRGYVEPNPMVGCVLAKNGQTIGEGWHKKFGEAHAEPTALNDCKSRGNDPIGATAYVTLEPCCHTNKKTPPCAPRLIGAKVARVVIGCLDPNPDVNGNGVAMLRASGIEVDLLPEPRSSSLAPVPGGESRGEGEIAGRSQVSPTIQTTPSPRPSPPITGARELDASHFKQLIAPFTRRQDGWLTITAKWAETANGKVSGPHGSREQISGCTANRLVHELRTRCDAIVVGINTVLADDPLLTPRDVPIIRKPMRCVLDSRLRLPLDSKLVRTARETPLLVFTGLNDALGEQFEKVKALRALGVEITTGIRTFDEGIDTFLVFGMGLLNYEPTTHVMVEAGPKLTRTVMDLWAQRLWVFRSKRTIGDTTSIDAPTIKPEFVETGRLDLGDDVLTEYLSTRASPNPYTPSADFVLASESL